MAKAPKSPSLWPTIEQTITRTPLTILREQAGYLGQQTSNIILGDVKSQHISGTYQVAHYLYIVAPALGSYRYLLLHIIHDAAVIYPLEIVFDASLHKDNLANTVVDTPEKFSNAPESERFTKIALERNSSIAKDEDELRAWLKFIFAHERTLTIIRSLMAQSQGT